MWERPGVSGETPLCAREANPVEAQLPWRLCKFLQLHRNPRRPGLLRPGPLSPPSVPCCGTPLLSLSAFTGLAPCIATPAAPCRNASLVTPLPRACTGSPPPTPKSKLPRGGLSLLFKPRSHCAVPRPLALLSSPAAPATCPPTPFPPGGSQPSFRTWPRCY